MTQKLCNITEEAHSLSEKLKSLLSNAEQNINNPQKSLSKEDKNRIQELENEVLAYKAREFEVQKREEVLNSREQLFVDKEQQLAKMKMASIEMMFNDPLIIFDMEGVKLAFSTADLNRQPGNLFLEKLEDKNVTRLPDGSIPIEGNPLYSQNIISYIKKGDALLDSVYSKEDLLTVFLQLKLSIPYSLYSAIHMNSVPTHKQRSSSVSLRTDNNSEEISKEISPKIISNPSMFSSLPQINTNSINSLTSTGITTSSSPVSSPTRAFRSQSPITSWICVCGHLNTQRRCTNCGARFTGKK
ncbi:hypothetical protein WA158_000410 [Blastocystis sp. Blastoise]